VKNILKRLFIETLTALVKLYVCKSMLIFSFLIVVIASYSAYKGHFVAAFLCLPGIAPSFPYRDSFISLSVASAILFFYHHWIAGSCLLFLIGWKLICIFAVKRYEYLIRGKLSWWRPGN